MRKGVLVVLMLIIPALLTETASLGGFQNPAGRAAKSEAVLKPPRNRSQTIP